jgi:hypothetical protein
MMVYLLREPVAGSRMRRVQREPQESTRSRTWRAAAVRTRSCIRQKKHELLDQLATPERRRRR